MDTRSLMRELLNALWDDPGCDAKYPLADLLEEMQDRRAGVVRGLPTPAQRLETPADVSPVTVWWFDAVAQQNDDGRLTTLWVTRAPDSVILLQFTLASGCALRWLGAEPIRSVEPLAVEAFGPSALHVTIDYMEGSIAGHVGSELGMSRLTLWKAFPEFIRDRLNPARKPGRSLPPCAPASGQ